MVIRNPFLIITGMHRSGTSFLARAMNLAGVNLGPFESLTSTEWKFYRDNERGHWENRKILELTNQTLKKNNGSWDNLPQKITINKTLGQKISKAVKELMDEHYLASGFKDPRIIPCLESWEKYLPKNSIIVAIFRDPLKVAESLKKRDGFSYEKSLSLWKAYNEKLISLLESHDGFLVNFDWPKEKLLSELKIVFKKLGLNQNVDLSEWYTKDIKKADKTYQADHTISKDVNSVYSKLKKISNNNKNVRIKKIKRGQRQSEEIIQNLLAEKQVQGQYFRKLNKENLELIKNVKTETPSINLLVSIFSKRLDLRESFPEVAQGDYNRLVNWAILVIEGKTEDEEVDNEELSKFLPLYQDYLTSTNRVRTEINQKIQDVSDLKEMLDIQNQSIQELQAFRTELESANRESIQKIVSLEKLKDDNTRKIGELEKLKDDNTRKIGELVKTTEEDTRKINYYISENTEQNNKIKFLNQENKNLEEKISNLQNDFDTIVNSIPYRIARDITTYLDKKVPPSTKRGKLLRKIAYNRYKKVLADQTGQTASNFSYDYHFDDMVDKKVLSSLNNSLKIKPKITIIMPVYNPDPIFLKKAIQSVKNQYYTNWQLCICDDASTKQEIKKILRDESEIDHRISLTFSQINEGISLASNKALDLADSEFTLLLDNDDELSKNALLEVVKSINETPDVDFIYSDEDKIDEKGNHVQPFFKPDWSPELFFSYNYPIHVSVFRTKLLKEIRGFRSGFEGAQDYDLILRYLEKTKNISHIPKVLYSWRKVPGSTALGVFEKDYAYGAGTKALKEALKRRNLNASIDEGLQLGTYRIKYGFQESPLISIIIPTKSIENLKVCVNSILKLSSYKRFEIIVMDSSKDQKIKNFCKDFKQVRCEKVDLEKFNFSKVNNEGVRKSLGEYIVFLNDDTEVINHDWIDALLEHAQRKEIGVVGAKLLYKDDHVQHAGTIVGIQRHAGNYGGMSQSEGGYFSFANIIRNCSAVTAACMMMKKETFEKIGGYDEAMANSWQDVDLCIRAINSGKLVVYTPYSLLYHYEGQTRGRTDSSIEEQDARRIFREKHRDFIKKGDPYYNPNLSLSIPYKVIKNYAKPLRDLVDLYEKRLDLQENFPNEQQNSFRNLIDWAATHGIVMDGEKEVLEPNYDYYFEKCSQNAKPLAKKIQLFLKDQKLQKKFPEVFNGNLEHFLKHTQKNYENRMV